MLFLFKPVESDGPSKYLADEVKTIVRSKNPFVLMFVILSKSLAKKMIQGLYNIMGTSLYWIKSIGSTRRKHTNLVISCQVLWLVLSVSWQIQLNPAITDIKGPTVSIHRRRNSASTIIVGFNCMSITDYSVFVKYELNLQFEEQVKTFGYFFSLIIVHLQVNSR